MKRTAEFSIVLLSSVFIAGCMTPDQSAYKKACSRGSKEAYSTFITQYPQSAYVPSAHAQIAWLEDRAKQERARSIETVRRQNAFVEQLRNAPAQTMSNLKKELVGLSMVAATDKLESMSLIKPFRQEPPFNGSMHRRVTSTGWGVKVDDENAAYYVINLTYCGYKVEDVAVRLACPSCKLVRDVLAPQCSHSGSAAGR